MRRYVLSLDIALSSQVRTKVLVFSCTSETIVTRRGWADGHSVKFPHFVFGFVFTSPQDRCDSRKRPNADNRLVRKIRLNSLQCGVILPAPVHQVDINTKSSSPRSFTRTENWRVRSLPDNPSSGLKCRTSRGLTSTAEKSSVSECATYVTADICRISRSLSMCQYHD